MKFSYGKYKDKVYEKEINEIVEKIAKVSEILDRAGRIMLLGKMCAVLYGKTGIDEKNRGN
jgi:predicted Zn-dependent protease